MNIDVIVAILTPVILVSIIGLAYLTTKNR